MKTRSASAASQQLQFRRHASIGAPDAEADRRILEACFVDAGDLLVLRSHENPKRIVVGRTGAGKSALLQELARKEPHAIELNPSDLALNHVANSNVIQFLENAGVNLDAFYQLLWKHVLVIEFLRAKYSLKAETNTRLWDILTDKISPDQVKRKAVDYVEQWAPKFWLETEHRVKEITKKFEEKAEADLKGRFELVEATAKGARTLSEESRAEIREKGQKVVNDVQIQQLSDVVKLLEEEVFTDPQQPYFIAIDTLDENWVDDRIKFKLIRALIEVTRSFQKIRYAKVVIALRIDLLRRVFDRTRDSGMQEEKIKGLCLDVKWSDRSLRSLLEKRINHLVRGQYSTKALVFEDVFPNHVDGQPAFEYMLQRTLMRPRDAIAFVNECIGLSEGKTAINSATIKQAEVSYSQGRLTSLADEWQADYPNLLRYAKLIEGRFSHFKLSEFSKPVVDNFVVEVCGDLPQNDFLYRFGQEFVDGSRTPHAVVIEVVDVLYRVGLLGIKPEAFNETQWAFSEKSVVTRGQIKPGASIEIHPAYWRALGIKPVKRHR
jgi:hypothetical protein